MELKIRRVILARRLLSAYAALCTAACGKTGDVQQAGQPVRSGNTLSCARGGVGEAFDRALAKCLTGDDKGTYHPEAPHSVEAVVFVDRSASMQGFLDPAYHTRIATDYRSVIDRALVGLHASQAFSFGSSIRPIEPALGALASRGFYSDGDTKTEDVLTQIARDGSFSRVYVIVTDGRRGSPNAALNQYVMLRALAQKWIAKGGSLVVGASMAPFTTVESDPSGCRRAEEAAADQRCPLYAFALVPPGAQRWVAGVFGSAFERLYSWPAIRVAGQEQSLVPPTQQTSVQFEQNWGPSVNGTPIVRTRGATATTQWTPLRLSLVNTGSLEGAGVLAALRGQHLTYVISVRRFGDGNLGQWSQISGSSAIIRPSPTDQMAIELVTRGRVANATPSLYRVDLMPDGTPSWLEAFDATELNDRVRTFGLGRLFEAFQQDARALSPETASLARYFIVAN